MKITQIAIILFIAGIICPAFVNAENIKGSEAPQYMNSSQFLLNKKVVGETILSAALSTGRNYDRLFGFQGTADYRFHKHFSAGVSGHLTFTNSDLNGHRIYDAALRFNYHMLNKKRSTPLRYDLYGGLSWGSEIYPSEVKFVKGFIAAHMGFRYRLDAKWLAFAEAGTRNSSIGLAFSF